MSEHEKQDGSRLRCRPCRSTESLTSHPLVKSVIGATPSIAVMVAILLLLRGVQETSVALRLQLATFARSFFGGSDELLLVALHTLPLALSAGIAVFAIARKWITFESLWSVVAIASIVWAGASVGGFLRSLAPPSWIAATQKAIHQSKDPSMADTQRRPTAEAPQLTTRSATGKQPSHRLPFATARQPQDVQFSLSPVGGDGFAQPVATSGTSAVLESTKPSNSSPFALSITASTNNLSEVSAHVHPDASVQSWPEVCSRLNWDPPTFQSQPDRIKPVPAVPRTGGIFSVVALALNQLLGYLVAYQPRLFCAAILGGGWLGWIWHKRVEKLT